MKADHRGEPATGEHSDSVCNENASPRAIRVAAVLIGRGLTFVVSHVAVAEWRSTSVMIDIGLEGEGLEDAPKPSRG